MVHPDKLIKARLDSGLDVEYLELATNTGSSRSFIGNRARTTAGQTGISGSDVKQVPIPLPPVAEQRRISQAVFRFLGIERAIEPVAVTIASQVVRLRQRLLQRAFDDSSSIVA